jgi:hypothetical protein
MAISNDPHLIGAAPNTGWLGGELALDDDGFVRTGDPGG